MKKNESVMSAITTIIKTIVFVGLFSCVVFISIAESEMVKFDGVTNKGKVLPLTGNLIKPDGEGPFPAVVLLPGCSIMYGLNSYNAWVSKIVSWGYITFQVDSFAPRNLTDVCDKPYNVHPYERMYDAFSAKIYLEKLSYVDKKRIAVMGWAQGGRTVLNAVNKKLIDRIKSTPFKAAISFYPYCSQPVIHLISPLLILFGEADNCTPANLCKNIKLGEESSYEIEFKIYPDVHHFFDVEGIDKQVSGRIEKYDPVATKDARTQVKNFLAMYLQ